MLLMISLKLLMMKIKVCGICVQEQFDALLDLDVDMIGLNFYNKSKRFLNSKLKNSGSSMTKLTGVFVNTPPSTMKAITKEYNLDFVQLHGDEDLDYIIKASQFASVIKVFRIKDNFDPNTLAAYEPYIEFFLLDTYSTEYGGSGLKFNWDILDNIRTNKQIILSGGISLSDVASLNKLKNNSIWGIDINSKFEIGLGVKDLNKIKKLISKIKS